MKASNSSSESWIVTSMRTTVDGFLMDSVTFLWLMMNVLTKFSLWAYASEMANMLNCILKVQNRIEELGESRYTICNVRLKIHSMYDNENETLMLNHVTANDLYRHILSLLDNPVDPGGGLPFYQCVLLKLETSKLIPM